MQAITPQWKWHNYSYDVTMKYIPVLLSKDTHPTLIIPYRSQYNWFHHS